MQDQDDTRRAMTGDTPAHDAAPDEPAASTGATGVMPHDTLPDTSTAVLQIDAARIAGVSVRTVQRAIDRGALPARREGHHCWIDLEDLERWRVTRATGGPLSRTTTHDTDAPVSTRHDIHGDTPPVTPSPTTTDDIERLRDQVADLTTERDRWHEAFQRESALREEETRQLRQLLQQEQAIAISFSRVQAIEATARHDTPVVDAPAAAPVDNAGDESLKPSADTMAFSWRRWWRRVTGGG
jgi:excisionase family DNA binding protein